MMEKEPSARLVPVPAIVGAPSPPSEETQLVNSSSESSNKSLFFCAQPSEGSLVHTIR